jgi:hypothetical protein
MGHLVFSRSKASDFAGDLLVLQGREAILRQASLLCDLAESCNQAGAMHWLEYFLDPNRVTRKPPYLVLEVRFPSEEKNLTLKNVKSAALFFEYRVFGCHTGVFATDDAVGFRTVIAPAGERDRVAARSAQALVDLGAHIVLVTYEIGRNEPHLPNLGRCIPESRCGYRDRSVGRVLRLEPSFDAMLARLGRSTRFNLRYYRRRLLKHLPSEFVPDVRPCLDLKQMQALNRGSLNPVTDAEAELRWHSSCELPGSFVVGLRSSAEGQWLSLIGGWRQGDTTVLYWQLNAAGYERDSIGTVMRSFFLEHEIDRGARRLLIFGGTPHSIRHAFETDHIADLVVCRCGLHAAMLRLIARAFSSPSAPRRRSNYLAQILCSADLYWTHATENAQVSLRHGESGSTIESGVE